MERGTKMKREDRDHNEMVVKENFADYITIYIDRQQKTVNVTFEYIDSEAKLVNIKLKNSFKMSKMAKSEANLLMNVLIAKYEYESFQNNTGILFTDVRREDAQEFWKRLIELKFTKEEL